MGEQEKTVLLDEFSHQVRRHFPIAVWRSLFEERTGRAEFGSAMRTLVCVECPTEGPFTREGLRSTLTRLAPRHEGVLDPCVDAFAFVSFATPEPALHLAVALQRLLQRARLRVGIVIGRCRMAQCSANGQEFLLLLGQQRERVAELTMRAAPATVQLAPEVYQALEGAISRDLGSCLVMAELHDEVVTDVSLALPPHHSADVSTFAGLGFN